MVRFHIEQFERRTIAKSLNKPFQRIAENLGLGYNCKRND